MWGSCVEGVVWVGLYEELCGVTVWGAVWGGAAWELCCCACCVQYFNEIVYLCSERSSRACIDENCCYDNHFSLPCTLLFVGALILKFFTLIL